MGEKDRYNRDRHEMVERQLASRGIRDALVLTAMRTIPRHLFVLEDHRHLAYTDGPLPIGHDQTISQPYIVALMTQLLELGPQDKVLEVGTGSGYQAAILGHIAQEVHTIEQHAGLAKSAEEALSALELTNVHVHIGDGSRGFVSSAPYEAIAVTAAAPKVPKPYFQQLADGGRLVVPVGGPEGQLLQRWIRRGAEFEEETIAPVAFVPLRGKFGWDEDEWRLRYW